MFVFVAVWIVVEVLVAASVADVIGILPTLGALAAASMLGVVVAYAAGQDAFARVVEGVGAGRMPGDELIDGALALAGGALLVVPGFVSAVIGLLVLIPGVRTGLRGIVRRRIRRRLGMPGDEDRRPPGDVIDV